MAKEVNPNDEDITIILTLHECDVLKSVCMEFLGSYKMAISRKRALIIYKILDKLEMVGK